MFKVGQTIQDLGVGDKGIISSQFNWKGWHNIRWITGKYRGKEFPWPEHRMKLIDHELNIADIKKALKVANEI